MITETDDLLSGELKQYRDALGLSQAQIAARLGVDRSTWTRWENGALQPHHTRILKAALNWLLVSQKAERNNQGDEFPTEIRGHVYGDCVSGSAHDRHP